jgi:Xaa-Pro aminopeptidase
MTFDERLAAIRAGMLDHGLDLVVAVHDGAHFIETPNPVFVLSRFKSLGPAAVVLPRDGDATLFVTPAWDADRAAECCPALRVIAADDVVDALASALGNGGLHGARIGVAGLALTRFEIAGRLAQILPQAGSADDIVFDATAAKTADEIAHAREATRIAELGYARLLEIARPGMSEDELAVELKWYTRTLGPRTISCCSAPAHAISRWRRRTAVSCRRATPWWPRSRRAIAGSSPRSAAPRRSGRRAPSSKTSTIYWCAP